MLFLLLCVLVCSGVLGSKWEWERVEMRGVKPSHRLGAVLSLLPEAPGAERMTGPNDSVWVVLSGGGTHKGRAITDGGVFLGRVADGRAWEFLPCPGFSPRYGHVGAVFGSSLVVVGGAGGNQTGGGHSLQAAHSVERVHLGTGAVEVLDTQSGGGGDRVWSAGGALENVTVSGIESPVDFIIVFGGTSVGTDTGSAATYALGIPQDTQIAPFWAKFPTNLRKPAKRYGHAASIIPSHLFTPVSSTSSSSSSSHTHHKWWEDGSHALVVVGGSAMDELVSDAWALPLCQSCAPTPATKASPPAPFVGVWHKLAKGHTVQSRLVGMVGVLVGGAVMLVGGGPDTPTRGTQVSALDLKSLQSVPVLAQGQPPQPTIALAAAATTFKNGSSLVVMFGGRLVDQPEDTSAVYFLRSLPTQVSPALIAWIPMLAAITGTLATLFFTSMFWRPSISTAPPSPLQTPLLTPQSQPTAPTQSQSLFLPSLHLPPPQPSIQSHHAHIQHHPPEKSESALEMSSTSEG